MIDKHISPLQIVGELGADILPDVQAVQFPLGWVIDGRSAGKTVNLAYTPDATPPAVGNRLFNAVMPKAPDAEFKSNLTSVCLPSAVRLPKQNNHHIEPLVDGFYNQVMRSQDFVAFNFRPTDDRGAALAFLREQLQQHTTFKGIPNEIIQAIYNWKPENEKVLSQHRMTLKTTDWVNGSVVTRLQAALDFVSRVQAAIESSEHLSFAADGTLWLAPAIALYLKDNRVPDVISAITLSFH